MDKPQLKSPAIPAPVARRIRHRSEVGMIGHYPWSYVDMHGRKAASCGPTSEQELLFTAEQLAARDAQWLEMVGPVVEALKDIAASIYMDDSGQLRLTRSFDESVITEALSAITKD